MCVAKAVIDILQTNCLLLPIVQPHPIEAVEMDQHDDALFRHRSWVTQLREKNPPNLHNYLFLNIILYTNYLSR